MGYPIQEQALDPYIDIYVTVGGTRHLLNPYVTQVTGNLGSVPDEYFCELQPGLCSVELYNPTSTVEGYLVPGTAFAITTHQAPLSTYYVLYYGTIRDVKVTYKFDDVLMQLVPVVRVECSDFIADVAGLTLPKGTLTPMVGAEKMSLANFYGYYGGATGYNLLDFGSMTTTYINQQYDEVNALDIINTVCRSANMFPYSTGTNIGGKVITAPTTYPRLITDGTHTGGTYTSIFKMTDVDYGYNSARALSSVTLNNVGLNRAPKAVNDSGLENVVVPYTKTQSIGFTKGKSFDTCVSTDNLGWNLLSNTGSESLSPQGIWPNDYFNFGVSPTMTLNNHPVTVATCNTAFSSRAFPLMAMSTENTFVTSPPGGMTGNWNLQFKVRGTTPTTVAMLARIVWYNASGTVLRTDNGTSTAFTNTAWTTITYSQATPPAGAVTAQAYAVVNGAAAVGYQFYISEAMFTRAGASTTFFNGDTADDNSYLYTWTGQIGNSPSQKNTNTLTSLATTILARNTIQKKVTSVTINGWEISPIACIAALVDVQLPQTNGIKICVNSVTGNYRPIGYSFSMTPTSLEITLQVTPV